MKIIRTVITAFSLYSRIPMPHIKHDEGDTGSVIAALPLVGAVIGALLNVLYHVPLFMNLPVFVRAVLIVIIPVAVTGGFHIDGYLDTEDALRSYQPRERKLEILKDPHVGSFAVTGFALLFLLALAGVYVIAGNRQYVMLMSVVFVLSRSGAALTSLVLPKAREGGMLVSETKGSKKGAVCILVIIIAAVFIGCGIVSISKTAFMMLAFAVFTLIYCRMVMKEFGGVTGDTAGYYIVVSEVLLADVLAICCIG